MPEKNKNNKLIYNQIKCNFLNSYLGLIENEVSKRIRSIGCKMIEIMILAPEYFIRFFTESDLRFEHFLEICIFLKKQDMIISG